MSIKFIFEDGFKTIDNSTPSSRLLKSSYNGNNIYFSNGNSNIITILNSIYNPEDLFIIFLDVVPNNKALVEKYKEYDIRLETDGLDSNTFIIPIFCIEYYLIKFLDKLGILFTKDKKIKNIYDNLYKTFNWGNLDDSFNLKSIEKIYKEIIKLQKPYCLRNENNLSKYYYGNFYKDSCTNCKDKRCIKKVNFSLEYKAELLYTSLPIFSIISEKHQSRLKDLGIETIDTDITYIKQYMQTLYNSLCKSMGVDKITIL